MMMPSAKFTNLISWSPICTSFIVLSTSMKMAITSAAIIYNTNESGHPWQTPCVRVKMSDRRPFILILDWMLDYATLIIQMKLLQDRKDSTKDFDDITERFLFSLFDTSAT